MKNNDFQNLKPLMKQKYTRLKGKLKKDTKCGCEPTRCPCEKSKK